MSNQDNPGRLCPVRTRSSNFGTLSWTGHGKSEFFFDTKFFEHKIFFDPKHLDPIFIWPTFIWTQTILVPNFLVLKIFWSTNENALEIGVWLWCWPNLFGSWVEFLVVVSGMECAKSISSKKYLQLMVYWVELWFWQVWSFKCSDQMI